MREFNPLNRVRYMSFATLFTKKSDQKQTLASLLQPDVCKSEQAVQPVFAQLLHKEATLSFSDQHPKYPTGTAGGKGGQFMPKGSVDYKEAIKDAKQHATLLAAHISGGGKDNDDASKLIAGKVSGHTKSAHLKGVDPEHMAQELTDTGLTQWQKKKLNLPLTAKEKDFTDKAMAAAMKLYNKKMAAKKSDEYKELLAKAEEAKAAHGESSKEYKVLMSKANKAAAKAMEYGEKPEVIAQAPQEVAQENTADKELKKKDLYNAALTSAKNSHLGITDTDQEQVHVKAYAAAKAHFSDDALHDIQQKAVAANDAKVKQGITNLAHAKAAHAKHQQFKDKPQWSDEYGKYKQAAADYQHHYNAGAAEHGLNAADKTAAVQHGYALHNAAQHGVQVIAPTGVPHEATPSVAVPTPEQVSVPEAAPVATSLPIAAQTNPQQVTSAISELDTPSKIKNALYHSAHDFAKIDAHLNPIHPEAKKALAHYKSVEAHAIKNGISQDTIKQLQDDGAHAYTTGAFKLPFKGKSKNKSKLPLAAQSATTQANDVEVPKPMAPTTVVNDDPYGYSKITDPEAMKAAIYDAYHKHSLIMHNPTAFQAHATMLAAADKQRIAAFHSFKITLGEAIHGHLNKAASDAASGVYDPPNANVAAPLVSPVPSPAVTPEQIVPVVPVVPATLANSMAAKPKKLKPTIPTSSMPQGTESDIHGLEQIKTKQQAENALYSVIHKLLEAKNSGDVSKTASVKSEGVAINTKYQEFLKGSSTIKHNAYMKIQNKAKADFEAGKFEIPNGLAKHHFAIDPTKGHYKSSLNTSEAPTSLATSLAATPKGKKSKVKPVAISSIPKGTEGDPYGLKQLDTKQKVANALYALTHEKALALKANNGSYNERVTALDKQGNAVNMLGKSMGMSYQLRSKIQYHARDHAIYFNKFELPSPQPKNLLYSTEGTSQPNVAHPYEGHGLKNHPAVAPKTDTPELAKLKKDVYNAMHGLTKVVNIEGANSPSLAAYSTALTEATHALKNKLQTPTYEQSPADNITSVAAKDYHNSIASQATPAVPEPVASPITASLTHLPTDKTEAEDLNKTLAKNYYTLRKLHGGDNNHPDVKAAYETWNKLKDHMKANTGHDASYFNTTSGNYKNEAESEYNAAAAAKAQVKQSALSGYKSVAENYHNLALLKGSDHPEVLAEKAGLDKAAFIAKQHLSEQELMNVNSEARQTASANVEKKKVAAVKEIHDASYKAHMVLADNGPLSSEHLASVTNTNNIAEKHLASGVIKHEDVIKAHAEAKVKAASDIKQLEAYKKMVGNPKLAAANYDGKANNFSYVTGDAKQALLNEGTAKWDACSPDEKSAIVSYTGSGYKEMNKDLVSGTYNKKVADTTKALDVSLGQDLKLRRNMPTKWFMKSFGLATDTDTRSNLSSIDPAKLQSLVGKPYHEPAFSSTSYDGNNGIMYSNEGNVNGGIILRIRADKDIAKGITIDQHSSNSSEREVILQQGATYIIRNVTKLNSGGKYDYEVEVDLVGHKVITPTKA